MKNRDIYEEHTRYKKHYTLDNDASVTFKLGILGPHTVLPVSLATATQCSFFSGSRNTEQILPCHGSCQDPMSKSQIQ